MCDVVRYRRWTRRIGLTLLVLQGAFAAACGEKVDPYQYDLDVTLDISGPVTYEAHVQPILEANCVRCHASDKQGDARNGAPSDINLDSYQGVFAAAELANPQIQGGSMPPDSGGISARERAIFQYWVDDGRRER